MVRYVYPKFNVYSPATYGVRKEGSPEGYHNYRNFKLVYLEPGDGHVIFDETLFDVPAWSINNFDVNNSPQVLIIGTDGDDKVSFKPTDPNWISTSTAGGGAPSSSPKLHFRTGWGNDELLIYHDVHANQTFAPNEFWSMEIGQSLGHKLTPGFYDYEIGEYVAPQNDYWFGPPDSGFKTPESKGLKNWLPSQKLMAGAFQDFQSHSNDKSAVNPNSKLTFVTNEIVDNYDSPNPGIGLNNGYHYAGEVPNLSFTLNGIDEGNVGNANAGLGYELSNYATGAINITTPSAPCFTRGTMIETNRGAVAVENLQPGDMLKTMSGEYRPLRWIGSRKIDSYRMEVEKGLRPIRILANTFGEHDELILSPQHRICIQSTTADLLFDNEAILASAKSLLNGRTVTYAEDIDSVEYFHLLLDEHEVIYANGALAETLLLSDGLMTDEVLEELRQIFGQEQLDQIMSGPAYGRVAKSYEAAVLTEMMQTNAEAV